MEEKKNMTTKEMTEMAMLTAVIVIMAFTPLGYLKTIGLEITFITIPVIIGAITMGPKAGAFLGGVFGLTSFIQCFGMSHFGAVLLSINPIFTFIVCVLPRILMGLICALVFKAFKEKGNDFVSYGVSSLVGALSNTVLFMSTLLLLFGSSDYITGLRAGKNVIAFVVTFVGINGIIEALSCFIIAATVSKAVMKYISK